MNGRFARAICHNSQRKMNATEVINQPESVSVPPPAAPNPPKRRANVKPRVPPPAAPEPVVVPPPAAPEPVVEPAPAPEPVKAVRAPPTPRVRLFLLECAFLKEQSAENAKAVLDGYAEHKMTKVVAHDGEGKSITCSLTSDGKWELQAVRKGTRVRCVLTTQGRRWLSEQLEGRPAPISTYCYE